MIFSRNFRIRSLLKSPTPLVPFQRACIKCHKPLDVYSLRDIDFESRRGKRLRDIDFICICFDCVKKQNNKRFKIFN